jgi:cob(I)alamin adenosyltransferase
MRISKVTTRTGDDGTTGLADGTRLPKDHPRIEVIGEVDELNSQLGLLLTEPLSDDIRTILLRIQNDLFDLGSALATPGAAFDEGKLARLDAGIAQHNAGLPPLREFILPGGSRPAALCHVARCVARRAERACCRAMEPEHLPPAGLRYLNRLSDLLFVLSRVLNRDGGQTEACWRHDVP